MKANNSCHSHPCGFLDFKTKLLILRVVMVQRETEVKTFGELGKAQTPMLTVRGFTKVPISVR